MPIKVVIPPFLEGAAIDELILKSIIGIMYAKVIEGKTFANMGSLNIPFFGYFYLALQGRDNTRIRLAHSYPWSIILILNLPYCCSPTYL